MFPFVVVCLDKHLISLPLIYEIFCAVKSGNKPALLDAEEPFKVAKVIRDWGLKYLVITSVCRDDLEDGGAGHISYNQSNKARVPEDHSRTADSRFSRQ